ncbi:phosphatidylinositol glycan, class V [Sporothrix brasiliensis 5110]|uniref:GPI mannosyltransferase 2 n=1 Tax=Sporothrix brasiliensis 5110 TaxID=1398154 RepID=A0A0C2FJN4_9PEZI|nr:phosphatidylinositol glycan, class V [Sporothrix brasiliensis 5110]KIH91243.1 phosphatidylinositol glycan, class V [Sporothrix brasiliensis 5110]
MTTQSGAAGTAPKAAALLNHTQHPYWSLAVVFGAWKACLLAIAVLAASAGPAYDTSGDLLQVIASSNGTTPYASSTGGYAIPSGGIVSRLTSWDAIYYVEAARRGHVYEQEWAFGAGLPLVVSCVRDALARVGVDATVAVVAVAYVHIAHLLAVFALYRLGCQLWEGAAGRTTAFVAACLHVLSPAGLFLSAPYAESSCALFSFVGYAAFAAGRTQGLSVKGDALRLLAGAAFGVATLFRSNGLLNGVVFAYEAVHGAITFLQQPSPRLLRRLVSIGLGGLAVAAGSVVPQAVAYFEFCIEPSGVPGEDRRPWCVQRLPSIYNFVQDHYWGSGRLFNYWTLSNLPLFLLATPMLLIMTRSGLDLWQAASKTKNDANKKQEHEGTLAPRIAPLLQSMAASQLLLAFMAFTSYHVQIVSRLSTAYPVWYWWLAQGLSGGPRSRLAGRLVVFIVMYASIQGMLFASFLPPA